MIGPRLLTPALIGLSLLTYVAMSWAHFKSSQSPETRKQLATRLRASSADGLPNLGWSNSLDLSFHVPVAGKKGGDRTSPNAAGSGKTYSNTTGSDARANATFFILARNSDLSEVLSSIRAVEDRFNKNYNYPFVFLNDKPFDELFIKHTSGIASGETFYGQIDEHHWGKHPDWIDEAKAAENRKAMAEKGVLYGDSVSYREMCRYESGFFFRHPILQKYRYYWRLDPNVKYFCDIDYDPFRLMQDENKVYGFTISLYEYAETIKTLWDTTKAFLKENEHYLAKNNLLEWLSNDGGNTYNNCHFWSNFEIADMDFWRGEAYTKYFEALDKAGGFFYERWGDAPVHSIAASLFAPRDKVHYFRDIGYRHEPLQHCPQNKPDTCACSPTDPNNLEFHGYSCTPHFKQIMGID